MAITFRHTQVLTISPSHIQIPINRSHIQGVFVCIYLFRHACLHRRCNVKTIKVNGSIKYWCGVLATDNYKQHDVIMPKRKRSSKQGISTDKSFIQRKKLSPDAGCILINHRRVLGVLRRFHLSSFKLKRYCDANRK